MNWFERLWEWLSDERTLWWLFAGSALVFVASPVLAGLVVARLPNDYFVRRQRRTPVWQPKIPGLRLLVVAGKNLLGALLVVAGMVMLVTPGQGLLSIAVGLMMLNFPGKYRLERWLITRKAVWRSANWLRRRFGKDELQVPR
jgi:hypothetical protein